MNTSIDRLKAHTYNREGKSYQTLIDRRVFISDPRFIPIESLESIESYQLNKPKSNIDTLIWVSSKNQKVSRPSNNQNVICII